MKLFANPDEVRDPGLKQFELEGWIDCSPFETLLGMSIERAAEGKAVLTMPFIVK